MKRHRRITFALGAALVAAALSIGGAAGASTGPPSLYVTDVADGTLVHVDPTGPTVGPEIPVGQLPLDVAITTDGTTAPTDGTTAPATDGTAGVAADPTSMLDGDLLNVDVNANLDADLAAPIAGAVAANANVAAPIDAAVSANIGSVGSEATAIADQDAIISQNIDADATATADQTSEITQ